MPSLNPFSYVGKRSSNIEAQERPQLFPPNYHTSIVIIKTICRAMLVILDLIGISPSYLPSQHVIYVNHLGWNYFSEFNCVRIKR